MQPGQSKTISRLSFINPFDLKCLLSFRKSPISSMMHCSRLNLTNCSLLPPYLWITMEQKSLIIHVSNEKLIYLIDCLDHCLRLTNSNCSKLNQSNKMNQFHHQLSLMTDGFRCRKEIIGTYLIQSLIIQFELKGISILNINQSFLRSYEF